MTPAPSNRRWGLWLPVLGVAAWLAVFGDKTPVVTEASPAKAGSRGFATPQVNPKAPLNKLAPAALTTPFKGEPSLVPLIPRQELILGTAGRTPAKRDLFASGSWSPPVTIAASPPTIPSGPPPLPFIFLGKKNEGSTWEVYLGRGEDSFIARQGMVIDGIYRIDAIDPPTLRLSYLPLGHAQSMAIGDPL